MGQYYLCVNLDKQQCLHAHKFHCGQKLLEYGGDYATALALLLADGNGRGGGDAQSDDSLIGSWAGDRIVLAGDYADGGKFLPSDATTEDLEWIARESFTKGYQSPDHVTLFHYARHRFDDISPRMAEIVTAEG